MSRLGEQLADLLFGLGVMAFARILVADMTAGIDQVLRGPVLIIERAPDPVIVVECDRVVHVEIAHGAGDVGRVALERELRRMHADDDESIGGVVVSPGPHVRQRAQTVDTRIRPHVEEHDMAAERRRRERRAC